MTITFIYYTKPFVLISFKDLLYQPFKWEVLMKKLLSDRLLISWRKKMCDKKEEESQSL